MKILKDKRISFSKIQKKGGLNYSYSGLALKSCGKNNVLFKKSNQKNYIVKCTYFGVMRFLW